MTAAEPVVDAVAIVSVVATACCVYIIGCQFLLFAGGHRSLATNAVDMHSLCHPSNPNLRYMLPSANYTTAAPLSKKYYYSSVSIYHVE